MQDFKDDNSVKFLNDPVVKEKLATAKKLADVSAKDYHALYIGGGHAPVMDLPTDPENNRLIGEVSSINSAQIHLEPEYSDD